MTPQRFGIGAQPLALGFFLAALGGYPLSLFVKGPARLAQPRQQVDRVLVLGAEQPGGLSRDPVKATCEVAGAGQEQGIAAEVFVHRGEEGAGPLLGRGDEEERRTEAVALAPGVGLGVLGVARRLLLEAAVRHRAHVQLDEGEQGAAVAVGDLDEDVGGDRSLVALAPNGERLAGLALALEAGQLDARRQPGLQGDVDLAEPGGVGEEERVGLVALTPARRRPAAGNRLTSAGRPEVMGCRAAFAVGAGATEEPTLGELGAAVAEGARGRRRLNRGELVLRQDSVVGEQREDALIEIR